MVGGIKQYRKIMELWPTAVEIFPGSNVTSGKTNKNIIYEKRPKKNSEKKG